MPQFNFSANREQAAKEYNLGKGEYFKLKDGDNRIRLISECLPHPGEYQGKPTFKWLCQVFDITLKDKDGKSIIKVQPFFMPDKVYQDIGNLQVEEGFEFEGVPMPYNINIKTTNAGKREAKYQVLGSPKRIELTEEQLQAIKDAPTIQELQKKIWENDKKQPVVSKEQAATEIGTEVNADDIPF